jgi:hypothetical protein
MPFSFRSTDLVSASIATSGLTDGSLAEGPSAPNLADPVVMEDPVVAGDPDELAVPALLMPGAEGAAIFAELPAPLGSLPELLSPPALAGPDGTPLTPAVPAPAEPALGGPTALPLPAEDPLLCANEFAGPMRSAMAMIDAVADILLIEVSIVAIFIPDFNDSTRCWFHDGTIPLPRH